MFTNNWYKTMMASFVSGKVKAKVVTGVEETFSGQYGKFLLNYDSYNNAKMAKAYNASDGSGVGHFGVAFGTGTTPPTVDDYCLSGTRITGYTYTNNLEVIENDNGYTITSKFTLVNNSGAEYTIGEIGLFTNVSNAGNSYISGAVLLERTVLDTPITVAADGGAIITYSITLEYPTM